jgi:hypothetical protein
MDPFQPGMATTAHAFFIGVIGETASTQSIFFWEAKPKTCET